MIVSEPNASNGSSLSLRVQPNAVCTECGCLCDDIELVVREDRITEAKNACHLGKDWFLHPGRDPKLPVALIDGKPAPLEQALARASEILADSKFPLLFGLSQTTCEAQRKAVALADRLGACLDTTTSLDHGPSGVSFPTIGEVTCSLGEVKNRADLVIFWGVDPATTHPRHGERYSVEAHGLFIPRGRADRYTILIDSGPSPHEQHYDEVIRIAPGADFEVLWALRTLVKGLKPRWETLAHAGVDPQQITQLAQRMKTCRFGVLFVGIGLSASSGRHMNNEAALGLVTDLNDHTRFFARTMKGKGNGTGADDVLLWQTGFPFSLHFGLGFPRYNPGEFSGPDALARGEPDAALWIGFDPSTQFPVRSRDHLARIPTIALDFQETATTQSATVAFFTARYGIEAPGTVCRMDDVSLPLRPPLSTHLPTDSWILGELEHRIRDRQAARIGAPNEQANQ